MSSKYVALDATAIAGDPEIDGLVFRPFRGAQDYPAMHAVIATPNPQPVFRPM